MARVVLALLAVLVAVCLGSHVSYGLRIRQRHQQMVRYCAVYGLRCCVLLCAAVCCCVLLCAAVCCYVLLCVCVCVGVVACVCVMCAVL